MESKRESGAELGGPRPPSPLRSSLYGAGGQAGPDQALTSQTMNGRTLLERIPQQANNSIELENAIRQFHNKPHPHEVPDTCHEDNEE